MLGSSLAGLVQHAAGEFVSAGENVAAGAQMLLATMRAWCCSRHMRLLGCRLACLPAALQTSRRATGLLGRIFQPCMHPFIAPLHPFCLSTAVLELVGHQDLRTGPPPERDHLVADALKQVGCLQRLLTWLGQPQLGSC